MLYIFINQKIKFIKKNCKCYTADILHSSHNANSLNHNLFFMTWYLSNSFSLMTNMILNKLGPQTGMFP